MKNVSNNNHSLGKFSKRVIFNSRTFNSKLFIKLASNIIDPSIICIQVLRYEQENRKIDEIESALPWLKTFTNLNHFINLKESEESSHKLLIELTWVLFYKYYKKNVILKRAQEGEEFFNLLLGGKILKLNIIYERESLTLEEYLIYIFKMKFLHEKEILKKCRLLNSFYADIDADNLHKFFKENPQFNYEKLKEIAKRDIIKLGFNIEDFQGKRIYINSIDNYLKISNLEKQKKIFTDGIKASPKLYIGKYVKSGYIIKGQTIGNLTKDLITDSSTYICTDNCDIAFINKKNSNLKNLYKLILEKKIRILSEFKKDFFLFNKITDRVFYNEVIPYFEYKQFHQGEKIFVQNSLYEGIYLIHKGEVNIYINSSVNDLGNYISKIKNSLYGLKESISILNSNNNNSLKEEILVKPKINNDKTYLTKEKNDILNEIKKYDVLKIPEYSIFGTNELYDHKNELYYFSAECTSKEAIIYFLPKKYFYSILTKEKPIYLALMEMVESKIKYIIGKIQLHIKIFEAEFNKKNKKLENHKINRLNIKDLSYNNNKSLYINSFSNLRRNNLTISDMALNKKNDKSLEFPPLVKDSKYRLNQQNNKINKILGQTLTSFSYKDKNQRSNTVKENINNNSNYKKIKIRNFHHSNPFNIYNKQTKSYGVKIFLKKEKKLNKNIKINLPNNFPFSIQNSYYNSIFYPK